MAGNQPTMTKEEIAKLGARVKELREKHRRGVTAAWIAGEVGVSRSAISQWEKGTLAPSLASILRLADAFGCDPGEFLEPFKRK